MRALVVTLAAPVLAGAAQGAPPVVTATATPAAGPAPLRVTLSAAGDAASYRWELGDGTVAEGAIVVHEYPAGSFVATVTATGPAGETAQASVEVRSVATTLSLDAPRSAAYERPVTLTGRLVPARPGAPVRIYRAGAYVTTVRPGAAGAFRARILLRRPGPYEARSGPARSAPRTIRVLPRIEASLAPSAVLGGPLRLRARLVPAAAGTLHVRVSREGRRVAARSGTSLRLRLPTGRSGRLLVRLAVRPRSGYGSTVRRLASTVVLPSLSLGDRGPGVLELERRLRRLRFALRAVDTVYAADTFEAVLAAQKLLGLPRTGRVDAGLWRRLARAVVPPARYGPGTRIEVDKTRQLLFEIVGGRVERIVHVSTGATGNTPLGRFAVYRKVTGFDWVLWYPLYFLRGFAIHGYPSVPAYPASHGCVRVPMWIAPALFARHPYGATVVVYA